MRLIIYIYVSVGDRMLRRVANKAAHRQVCCCCCCCNSEQNDLKCEISNYYLFCRWLLSASSALQPVLRWSCSHWQSKVCISLFIFYFSLFVFVFVFLWLSKIREICIVIIVMAIRMVQIHDVSFRQSSRTKWNQQKHVWLFTIFVNIASRILSRLAKRDVIVINVSMVYYK